MATFVLVHGAWHGAWCWRDVAAPLRAAGHDVVVPTLVGLGERAGEFRPDIGLRDHVDDVVGALEGADLRDVVLVGHSYAGLVVREAADRVPERVARLEMVDAWAGPDGASIDSLAPEYFRNWVDSVTDGGAIPVPAARTAGVTEPEQVAWVESLMAPQPRRTFSDPTRLTGAVDAIPCRAVVCTPPGRLPFGAWARGFGWPIVELESGHDAPVTAPGALADILRDQP